MNSGKRLSKIVHELTDSYKKSGGINVLKNILLPSQKSVIEILKRLRALLLPGYYEETTINNTNLEFVTGQQLSWIRENLTEEIRKSLCFVCKERGECDFFTECKNKAEQITWKLLESFPDIRIKLNEDVEAAFQGDPAAKSRDEVLLSYPGLAAVTVYRLAHFLWEMETPLIPRIMAEHIHHETGIDIHPGAKIGRGIFIDHGTGVVIGETTTIGNKVKIYQGVTLGALSIKKESGNNKRHPTIEDDVTIYAGATILGGKTIIGKGSIIGGNVWLTESVPPGSKVYNKEPRQGRTTRKKI